MPAVSEVVAAGANTPGPLQLLTCLPFVLCVLAAPAGGGSEARHPGRAGPLAAPAGPHSPEDQGGGPVVPPEGLHAAGPGAAAQERRRVHRGHPDADRQRAR